MELTTQPLVCSLTIRNCIYKKLPSQGFERRSSETLAPKLESEGLPSFLSNLVVDFHVPAFNLNLLIYEKAVNFSSVNPNYATKFSEYELVCHGFRAEWAIR